MEHTLDLKQYFRRIGYTGPATACLGTFQKIHRLHPQNIPFENLNPFLGLPVKLDLESLEQKLVKSKRGGFCFEQNTLLSQVLKQLGFKVKGLAARVMWNLPEDTRIARGHMLLLVELSGEKYIADVGFGGATLTTPLRLLPNQEQATTLEPFRFIQSEEEYVMEVKIRNVWRPVYCFGLQEHVLADYEVTNYFLCHHPGSQFIQNLIVARTAPKARFTLRHNEFAIHSVGRDTERKILTNPEELKKVLAEIFLIDLPDVPDLEQKLQQLFEVPVK